MAEVSNEVINLKKSPVIDAVSSDSVKYAILANSIGFYVVNISKDLIEYDFVAVQGKQGDFSINVLGLTLPCKLSDFFMRWKKKMLPKDQEVTPAIEGRIPYLLDCWKKGKYLVSLNYWTKSGDESLYYVSEDVILYQNDDNDICALLIMRDATDKKHLEEQMRQQEESYKKQLKEKLRSAQLIHTLSDDYESLYYVDLESKEMIPYRLSDVIEKEYGAIFRSGKITYDQAFKIYIEGSVFEDDKKEMYEAVTEKKLLENFDSRKVYFKDYRVLRDGKISYYQMKIANLSKEDGHHTFLFGFSDINDFKIKDLERYAYVDPLTNGDNYIKFKKNVLALNKDGYIISMDINSFKIINSICGVVKGDQILQQLWNFLKASIKINDLVAHVYADRFVIFLPDRTETEVIELTRMITHMLSFLTVDMEIPQLKPYFGIAEFKIGDELEKTYSHAVSSKKKIKGRLDINYTFFRQIDTDQLYAEKQMEDEFETALQTGQFEIWFQPKFSPGKSEVLGAEALVRWRKPDGKLVPPSEFIPLFERDGLIRTLDEYVFRKVCILQKEWSDKGRELLPISVNLSRASIYYKNIAEQYKWLAEKIGIDPQFVPIEITESAAVSNNDLKILADRFYDAGFPLHMDDFGSGYSSLATLNTMHFNTLKIDKSLVDFIGNYSGDRLLVHSIALAKELGMHVTAEGVENHNQVNFLKELNCDSIQGYVYSKPITLEEFEAMYAKDHPEAAC